MSMLGGIRSRLDTVWGGDIFGAHGLIWQGDSLQSMRDRSRRLEENNVLACGVLDRAVENVIGTEITLRAATLDSKGRPDKAFNTKANDEWRRVTEETRLDVRRLHTFGQLQQLAYRALKRDGDIGCALIDRGYGPELQLIEGQDVETPPHLYGSNIINGVEVDGVGRPVAFWVRVYDDWGTITHRRVEARDVIWMHDHFRYNVVRGVPTFNGGYVLFDQIWAVLEAVVVAARIGASQAMIVETENPSGALAQAANAARIGNAQGVPIVDGTGIPRGAVPIQPGMINYVRNAKSMQAFNPTQPQVQFPDSMRTFSRFVGLKWGLTVERVLLDFSKANYSVSRSTALQEQKTAEMEQDKFYRRFLLRVWRFVISKRVKSGHISGPVPDDFWRHDWMPQGRPLVEPSKDAPGEIMLIKNNLNSFKNYTAARGESWDQIARDNAEALELFASLHVTPPADDQSIFSNTPIAVGDDTKTEGDDDEQQD